jgi:AraC-like DNA-binding protein
MREDDLVFLATTREPRCDIRLDKRLDGYHTIQFMTEGGVELFYDERGYTLQGGAWFWPAFPGPRLRFHAAPGYATWFHRHVGFRGPLVQRWEAQGLWPREPQPAPVGKDYAPLFDEMIVLARRADRWGRLRAVNLLEQLLLELAEDRAQAPAREPWLGAVLERLSRGDAFAPDWAGIAAEVGMGASTLRRRFRHATGMPPHAYVLQARMASARALVGETELPFRRIAEQLGYDNVHFFSRQFRQHLGVPPGVYRKSRQT